MDGVHDLGGMHGFGPVEREDNEPPFHAPWEAAVVAIMRATRGAGLYNIDEFRHGIERMDPAHYLGSSYFEHWLDGIARVLTRRASSTPTSSRRARPSSRAARRAAPAPPCAAAGGTRGRAPGARRRRSASATAPPRFAVGAAVIDAQHPPGGPHAAAALRPRQARGDRRPPRVPRLPRHQRARSRRAAAARLQRPLRRARAVGRGGRAEPARLPRSLGELPAARLTARRRADMGKNHPNVDDYVVSRVRALESLLLEKGLLAPDAVDRVIRRYETEHGPDARRARGGAGLARSGVQAPPAGGLAGRARRLRRDLRPPRRGREHAGRPQRGRLHALLLLPVGRDGAAADLVQDARLSLARRQRAAQGARRVRPHRPARARDPRVGQLRRAALHGAADGAGRRRAPRRGRRWRATSRARR